MNTLVRSKQAGLFAVVLATGVLTACSGGSGTTAATSAPPTSTPSASPTAAPPGGKGCKTATTKGTVANTSMQTAATTVFNSLNCAGATTMTVQLEAALKDPAVQESVKAAGATMFGGSTSSGTAMTISDGKGACQIVVIDSMKLKTLNCNDM